MADYWKSQPKKFCEACKCWFADNKASIDFHEKGKNHQANVQQRIKDIMKKGKKMYKAKQNYENMMDEINQAALRAFEKDVEGRGSKVDKLQYAAEEARLKERAAEKQEEVGSLSSAEVVKPWFEAVTPEGETYYWNMKTGESIWEKPSLGYVSLAEQQLQDEQVKPKEAPVSVGSLCCFLLYFSCQPRMVLQLCHLVGPNKISYATLPREHKRAQRLPQRTKQHNFN